MASGLFTAPARRTSSLAAIALLVAACTGSTDASSTTTGTPSTAPAPTTVTTTTTTTSPEPTTTTSTTSLPSTTTTTVASTFATIPGTPPDALSSFASSVAVVIDVAGQTIAMASRGVYTDEALRCDTDVTFAGVSVPLSVIMTPSQTWIDRGNGFETTGLTDQDVRSGISVCGASPSFWTDYADLGLEATGEADELNSIPVERFELDEFLRGAATFGFGPQDADGVTFDTMTVWVADPGGWLAGLDMAMTFDEETGAAIFGQPIDPATSADGTVTFQIAVTDPDDGDLVVELPDGATSAPPPPAILGASLPAVPPNTNPDNSANGLVIPGIVGTGLDGSDLVLDPADGRAKAILFLAHWCPHCQDEVTVLQEWLDETGGNENVDLYAVSTAVGASRANYPPEDWLEAEGWTVPTFHDGAAGEAHTAFGAGAFPFWVFVDSDGRVAIRTLGELGIDQLESILGLLG